MRRSILVLVVGLAIAFGGTAGAGDDLAAMTNQERQAQGRQPLTGVAELQSFAQRRAEEMAAARKLWHTQNLGGQISNWRRLGENLGRGPRVGDIHRDFMSSADHRDNILLPEFSEVGVGVASDGGQMVYVTVIFRQPADPPPPPPVPPAPAPKAAQASPPTTRAPRPTTTTTAPAPPPPTTPVTPPGPAVDAESAPSSEPDLQPEPEPPPAPVEQLAPTPLMDQHWFVAANTWDPGVGPPRKPGPMRPAMAGAVVGLVGLCGGVHHRLRRRLR